MIHYLSTTINNFYNGTQYSLQDFQEFVQGYVQNTISEQLMSKFLESIYLKGLSLLETFNLTRVMLNSGQRINLDKVQGIKVDKHSTGGVGDNVSLILAPILSAAGLTIVKMSGKSLGFTGGTIDKLSVIPGFKTNLTNEQFEEQAQKIGIVISSQTQNLVPADQKIYQLRNRTGYVNSLPLIASSVMSKKLAISTNLLLLDVKCGNGAFATTLEEAHKLATLMLEIAKGFKRNVKVEITTMEQPLGQEIGNKNEVLEAIQFLQAKPVANDLKEVVFSSAATILLETQKCKSQEEAFNLIEQMLKSGLAFAKFKEWMNFQGADFKQLTDPNFWNPAYSYVIKAPSSGFVEIQSTKTLGIISRELGTTKEELLDKEAGITIHKKTNAKVQQNEPILTLHSSSPITKKLIISAKQTFKINPSKVSTKVVLNQL